MNNDILSVLQERATTFSKGQRAIARYITDSYDKAAFMTASKLGRTVGVSESTVVRFAVELGYDGYPTMQKAMQEMVLNRLTSVQRIEVANDRIGDQDILSLVLQSDMEQLRKTVSSVDRKDFSAAVNAILDARRIYVLGVRSASALASFLGYYLNLMFEDVHTITDSGTGQVLEKLISTGPDDVVIAFSYPRYSTSTVTGASFCHSKGAKIIAMTDSRTSPLGQTSDFVLQTKSDMASLVDSLVAPLSVVNALVVALAARREEKLAKTFSRLEEIWETYQVYEKQDD
ncbi:MAG: MurR/RpiR family transcriptional regulator [Candidatus Faecousia sp.]|nr:MurR/RpiR family transcriptional regulator [Clostridiales bacterium]MDD7341570.1 MurR/RpiR family transcriptional regulator [Bacillota bacterium]MDY2809764.1 MurR/RpiR family transcriptional regulator [Candidatus Faecousia sp.]